MIDNVSKLTIDDINVSLFRAERIDFQSEVSVPSNNKQIDSSANLTTAGGLAMDLTSANCFFLMPLTAKQRHKLSIQIGNEEGWNYGKFI